MTKRRVFIAINLPEKIKNRLIEYRERYAFLPVRWTKKNSLHLTLIFIGYVSNEQVLEICRAGREVTKKAEPFMLRFKMIVPGPIGKPPRMIWVRGEENQELSDLKNQLEDALLGVDSGLSRKEYKPFSPHITLARVNQTNKSLPEDFSWTSVEESFNFQVPVQSLEIMESDLRSDGAEYAILESCPMGE